ncbi:MAG: CPBP family intramembrane metalloprotease [Bacillus sp. (in: Bacteria)]|nr:CPBP family intramembrane metalloprotease [Bacillus sp. (in: firmicutes)]MCM1427142.1 CPBP family intramembrane metalloprotease [Eubacterium sp.]
MMKMNDTTDEYSGYRKYIRIFGDIVIPFFIYFCIYILALIGLTSLVITILQNTPETWQGLLLEQETTVNAVIGGFAMLLGIVPLVPMFRREISHERDDKVGAGAGIRTGGAKIFLAIALAVTSSVAINIFFILLHLTETSEAYAQTAEHQYGVLFPFGLFLYGVVSPLAEEVVFRGIIYNRMKKYFPAAVSMVLSALFFGLYHGNAVQAFYGFCMGMLIAYTYEKFGGFFYAFLFHAAANAAVYTITGNSRLYEMLIRPYVGIVFAGIAVGVVVWMGRIKDTKPSQEC